jgi:sec-independent protein translocase protein TatC
LNNTDFLSQLAEFRSVLIKSLLFFLLIFIIMTPFANNFYNFFAEPLLIQLEILSGSIISTKLTATFVVPFKITAFISLLISLPIIFFQIWYFISPGLFLREKKFIAYSLCSGYFLFLLSSVFVYFIIFPIIFKFFVILAPSNLDLMIDISSYLEMILALFMAFGIAFQLPIILIMAVRLNWITLNKLKKNRPYMIVGAFVFGAIFTPPDVISQILLAIPILILYEIGIFLAKNNIK